MRIPASTYRLQFNKQFTFSGARAILDYLRDLGISDLYCSPLLRATPESTHGYDACDPCEFSPSIGTPGDFEELARQAKARGMHLLLDIVPNHQGVHSTNPRWWDVLQRGLGSEFARYFDIDWESSIPGLRGKVLLPVLGDHYNAVLERGELKVVRANGEWRLAYFDKQFPLSADSAETIAESELPALNADANRLHELIDRQHYRLAFWRTGPHELNYRRFFDVTELICVRVEDPAVFESTHRFIFELVSKGHISGLRVDHPDGLRDPQQYFQRLRERTQSYIVAEKIISGNEELPRDWPVDGTTGYDYLIKLNGLFVDSNGEAPLTQLHAEFTGEPARYEEIALNSKRLVLEKLFVREVDSLATRLKELAGHAREGADLTWRDLRRAIVEFIAAFPVYRTYIGANRQSLTAEETERVNGAIAVARSAHPELAAALEFLGSVLRLQPLGAEEMRREFVARFQQLTGPATAKGLEDTAFYRYFRLLSLNEVGGEPGIFGTSPSDFHAFNSRIARDWPHTLLATATHDTKRGEDLRARLNVLSEIPGEWRAAVARWREAAKSIQPRISPNDEYLLFQTLLGAWTDEAERDPKIFAERVKAYMLKAARESKSITSWTEPNNDYEHALQAFVDRLLETKAFIEAFLPFQKRVAFFGRINSLSQLVLKLFSPGVPDTYQGAELWDFSLVDPDNRRPVDFAARRELLDRVRSGDPALFLGSAENGAIKFWLLWKCLNLRRERRDFLADAGYEPVAVTGQHAEHVCAFARTANDRRIVVAVPRLCARLLGGKEALPIGKEVWGDTRLGVQGEHIDLLSGKAVGNSAGEVFGRLPCAVLEKMTP